MEHDATVELTIGQSNLFLSVLQKKKTKKR